MTRRRRRKRRRRRLLLKPGMHVLKTHYIGQVKEIIVAINITVKQSRLFMVLIVRNFKPSEH